ncbi:MAG: hypothetical protein ACO1SX_23230 [Actinomycetota bacterium]
MTIRRKGPIVRLAAVGALALAGASVAGQEAPPPAQEVSLVYKYKTGSIQKFRMEAKSDLTVTPDGGGIGPLPISSKITTLYTEKVTGTRAGTGTLSARVDSFLVDTDALGNRLVGRLVKGKLTYTVNGQPAPEGGIGAALSSGAEMSKPLTLKRNPLGVVTEGGSPNAGGAGPGNTLAQFPERPLKVGDTWETSQPMGAGFANGPLGGAGAALQATFTHTLKSLVTKDKRVFAMIESIGATTPMEGEAGPAIKQNISGISRFDVERGVLVGGQYSLDLSMKVGAPALLGGAGGGPAEGAAPPNMKVDGITSLTIQEIPNTPAKPAAKKPAVKKKTVRKR